ncbi:hypothetical protein LEL_01646 [Akanthomyces lecanii RCEF 1005]|uniref:Uncharacterized protein n=1 Tax=Akanthomyces lecanii RCEF 1005 TaxID=1081108 RepID=A0A168KSW2_CORDF|nr:hypothetical protein LEL_01646 [Akanthomyces lecanii RCEF 1005]
MRDNFAILAYTLQDNLTDAVRLYLDTIHESLELVRNENTAEESQRDLEFHGRVSDVVRRANNDIRRIHESIQ